MSHFVRLEVVPDAERPELCGEKCPHLLYPNQGAGFGCSYFKWMLRKDGDRALRYSECARLTTLDEAERSVIEAASALRGDNNNWRIEEEMNAAVDRLAALRAERNDDAKR